MMTHSTLRREIMYNIAVTKITQAGIVNVATVQMSTKYPFIKVVRPVDTVNKSVVEFKNYLKGKK